jgi:thiol:disulfide interchange protein DsbC
MSWTKTLGSVFLVMAATMPAVANQNLWQSLSLKNALVYKQGNGKKQVAMITALNCGYCRLLEQELTKMDDITIYKFITPIQGGYSQSVSVWCSADRNKAYAKVLLRQEQIQMSSCNNPIASNLAWFYKNKLVGAPALISTKGEIHYGVTSKEELIKWLN